MIRFPRSIRTKLLASAALLLAAATLASGLLVYRVSRNLLEPRLTSQLEDVVSSTRADIERILHIHAQNVKTWAGLALMREIVVHDIDKTVSSFLRALYEDYGTYSEVSAFSPDGICVASSHPARIGKPGPDVAAAPAEDEILVRSTPGTDGPARIELLTTIHVHGTRSERLGVLRVTLAPMVLRGILARSRDDAEVWVALSDARGKLLAGELPDLGPGAYMTRAEIRTGPMIHGADWSFVAAMPRSVVAGPIRHLRNRVFLVGSVVGLFALVIAWFLSRSLLVPIKELTETTSRIAETGTLEPIPAPRTDDEVGDLTRSFQTMVDNLAAANERLVQSAKLAFLGEMAAGLAHEVRTPLGIVKNAAQLLERRLRRYDDEEASEYTVFIREEVDRLNRVVTDMLDVARPARPDKRRIEVDAVVDRAVAFLASQATGDQVSLVARHARTPLAIVGDSDQIYQAVLNLVINAIQACSPGGEVIVETAPEDDGVVLRVSDDGCGIPESLRGRLFSTFSTRRDGGIGLGLAIVARIVASHGGRVDAAARPGGGTVFTVFLPSATDEED